MKLWPHTKYGFRPKAKFVPAPKSMPDRIQYTTEWIYHSIPATSQGDTNACVGFTVANWIEAMLRKDLGRDILKRNQQIDGVKIWETGRKMFFPNEPVADGGLWLDHGFRAAIAMGLLPDDSIVQEVNLNNFDSISRFLADTPLAMAQATHSQWNHADSDSGFIRKRKGDPYAGHAILMVGMTKQKGVPYAIFQNSWGLDWGWHGLGLLSEAHYLQNTLSNCYTALLHPDWHRSSTWRDYVI